MFKSCHACKSTPFTCGLGAELLLKDKEWQADQFKTEFPILPPLRAANTNTFYTDQTDMSVATPREGSLKILEAFCDISPRTFPSGKAEFLLPFCRCGPEAQ